MRAFDYDESFTVADARGGATAMTMTSYRFGDFDLDDVLFELRLRGERLDVPPKVLELVLYLVTHHERVVAKEELERRLWPDAPEGDASLSHAVMRARAILGSDGHGMIATMPGTGFQFAAGVRSSLGAPLRDVPAAEEPRIIESRDAKASVFVGRQACMTALRADLDAAIAGSGRVVLLSGEPGIGKTRTAEELVAVAREAGARAVIGRCHDGGDAAAFWPWVVVLRAFMDSDETRGVVRSMPEAAREVARIVPEISALWPDESRPSLDVPESRSRSLLFDSIATLLRGVATERAMLIVLDDLHWADTSSLLLLELLARELRDARVLVVGTFRSAALDRAPVLARVLATIGRERLGRTFELDGLGPADVARLVESATGQGASHDLVGALHERTGGNPFHVTQLLDMLAAEGGAASLGRRRLSALPPPSGAGDSIGHHLTLVSEPCRRALGVASIFGRDFDAASVATVAKLPSDAIVSAMNEAAVAKLVSASPDRPGRYRFVHALVRNALYDAIDASEKARLHEAAADALEGRRSVDPPLAELARHRLRAAQGAASGDGETPGRAILACTAAARQAIRRTAFEEARIWYERAIRLLDGEETSTPAYVELLLGLADAQRRAGDLMPAQETFAKAIAAARAAGEPAMLVDATMGYAALAGDKGSVDADLIAYLGQTLADLADDDGPPWARIAGRLAEALVLSEQEERRQSLATRALDVARRYGEADAIAFALLSLHAIAAPGPERGALSAEAVEAARDAIASEIAPLAARAHMIDRLDEGDVAGADHDLAELGRLAAELRQPLHDLHFASATAARALLAGRLGDAETEIQRSRELARRVAVFAEHEVDAQWALLLLHQGRLVELEEPLRRLAAPSPCFSGWLAASAMIAIDRDRPDEAGRTIADLTADGLRRVGRDRNRLAALAMMSEVCARVEAPASAEAIYAAMIDDAPALVTVDMGRGVLGATSRYLGILASVLERWDAAEAHFEDARAIHERIGARSFAALGQQEYAAMLLARGRPDDRSNALMMADHALTTARELGMVGLVRRVEALSPRSHVVRRVLRRP